AAGPAAGVCAAWGMLATDDVRPTLLSRLQPPAWTRAGASRGSWRLRAAVPGAALLLVLLAATACDEPQEPFGRPGPDAQRREDALTSRSAAAAILPDQITVDDADQLDPLDPGELHVPVPEGQEAVVQAR